MQIYSALKRRLRDQESANYALAKAISIRKQGQIVNETINVFVFN